MPENPVAVGPYRCGQGQPLLLIAGPCVLEDEALAVSIAQRLKQIVEPLPVQLVFKASFDKANRTSLSGRRGPGLEPGLEMLAEVRARTGCPVLTDIHTPEQCAAAAEAVDILQIPAFLCRPTDLLLAAGETGAAVNIKKGQFLAPWDMENVAEKVASTGNRRILLTERGNSFGYNTLVADMRSLPQMMRTGYPVVMDATHAVQQPGGLGGSSGGQREFAPVMARAAAALGIAAVFIETHDAPDRAPSDGPNMVPLSQIPELLGILASIDRIAKASPIRI